MKKALSFTAVLGILLSTFSTALAQRTRLDRFEKPVEQRNDLRVNRNGTKSPATEFGRVEAFSEGQGVLLKWQMGAEAAILGYRIYRTGNGNRTSVDDQPLLGSFSRAGRYVLYGGEYSYFDANGEVGSVYEIEAQDADGKMTRSKTFSASFGRLPNLKGSNIPGTTSSSNRNSQMSAESIDPPSEVLEEVVTQFGQSDPDTHKWVMSNPGVRIDVKKEGIYRVPFAQLLAAGFDTNTDSANWQLYVRGVQQAIRVSTADGYIEFYGKGVDTKETDIQGYFLLNGTSAGKRMSNVVARPPNNAVVLSGYSTSQSLKERLFYLNGIFNGDAENYFGRTICAPTPTTCQTGTDISFDVTGVDISRPTSSIDLKLQGYSATLHSVRVSLNGQVLGTMGGVSQFSFTGSFSFATSLIKDKSLGQGTNTLNLASIGSDADNSLFDSFTLNLNRKHRAESGTLKAYTVNSKVARLRGFGSTAVRVFEITDETAPRLVTDLPFQAIDGTFGVDLPAGRPRVFFAVDDSALLAPVGITAHDGETLGTSNHAADLIIISYKAFMTQANTWAAYRSGPGQGFGVKVVDVDEIMNEFNYGVLNPDAIEAFLSYAYHNWQTQPGYVLLIGDASFDSRNYENLGFFNYVPTRIVTTAFSETGSDESLADFDNDGLSEIAIGRIPARLASTVTTAYNKTVNWETNLLSNPLGRGTLFAYDVFDGSNNFEAMSVRIRDELPAGTQSTMISRGQPNAHADLIQAMNNPTNINGQVMNAGKYIINYSGHGAAGLWGVTTFFGPPSINELNNSNNEAVYTMLTCLNGDFLGLHITSLSERLINAQNGGAVAAWASTGLTISSVQEQMGRRFYNQVGQGNIHRMGDLIKDAKTVVTGGTDVRLSWALIGDPMLKVR